MPEQNPFPLEISYKVDSPELLAYMLQFGDTHYVSATDLNLYRQALTWLYENRNGDGTLTDTKFKSKRYRQTGAPTPANIAARINLLPAWTILSGELYLYAISFSDMGPETIPAVYTVVVENKGFGKYGDWGEDPSKIVVAEGDIRILNIAPLNPESIENEETTQKIEFGEIGFLPISQVVDLQNPVLPLQDQDAGYVLIKTLRDGNPYNYWFVGPGRDYGVGTNPSSEDDFKLLGYSFTPSLGQVLKVRDREIKYLTEDDFPYTAKSEDRHLYVYHDNESPITINVGEIPSFSELVYFAGSKLTLEGDRIKFHNYDGKTPVIQKGQTVRLKKLAAWNPPVVDDFGEWDEMWSVDCSSSANGTRPEKKVYAEDENIYFMQPGDETVYLFFVSNGSHAKIYLDQRLFKKGSEFKIAQGYDSYEIWMFDGNEDFYLAKEVIDDSICEIKLLSNNEVRFSISKDPMQLSVNNIPFDNSGKIQIDIPEFQTPSLADVLSTGDRTLVIKPESETEIFMIYDYTVIRMHMEGEGDTTILFATDATFQRGAEFYISNENRNITSIDFTVDEYELIGWDGYFPPNSLGVFTVLKGDNTGSNKMLVTFRFSNLETVELTSQLTNDGDGSSPFATSADLVAAIVQLINGAPSDANTLKELSDKINAINAIIGGTTADGDTLVNTVAELLAVFQTYPEGANIATVLAGKINSTDIVNNLTQLVAGKVLDATQGKILSDAIATKQTALTESVLGTLMHGYTAKPVPADADELILSDSADTQKVKRMTFTNLKAFLKTYFDGLYQNTLTAVSFGTFIIGLASKATPIDGDSIVLSDSADSDKTKKVLLSAFFGYVQGKFDLLYSPKKSFIVLSAPYVLTNQTAQQKMFPTANFAAKANSLYHFKLEISMSNFSAAGNNTLFQFLGTAVITDLQYNSLGHKAATSSAAQMYSVNSNTPTSIAISTTSPTARYFIEGIFRTAAAGSVFATVGFGVSTGPTIDAGTFILFERLGSNTDTYSNDIS